MVQPTMNAMVLMGHGDMDQLRWRTDWPKPIPQSAQVLIQVHACGLNNTDVNTRTGWYSKGVSSATGGDSTNAAKDDATWGGAPLTFPRIQGADVVGTVMDVGPNADANLMGKRVLIDTWLRDWDDPTNLNKTGYFGSECDGGFAEFTAVDARQVHPIQSDLTDAELATFATSYITAENMLNRASVTADDTVLIPGASGGVGSALIQLAKRRGATTIALCSADKKGGVMAAGADHVLDRQPTDLASDLAAILGNTALTVVADVVGGTLVPTLLNVLARGGRYTCAGAIAGPMIDFDLRTFYLKDLTLTGATIVPPGVFADLVGYIERGEIKPLLAETFRLEDLHQAQSAFMAKAHVGNIVVTP